MSLETTIAGLVAAANKLTDTVNSKISVIDNAVSEAQASFGLFKTSSRSEYPAVNVLPNASFFADANADGIPDSWAFSSANYMNLPSGAAVLVQAKLETLTAHQTEIEKLGRTSNSTGFVYLNALRLSVKGDAVNAVWARVQASLVQAFAGLYSGGCFMNITNPGAIVEAGVGGGNYYSPGITPYNLSKGGWQWVSSPRGIVSYQKAHCINFKVNPGRSTDVLIAMPVAVDGYLDRPVI